MNQKRVALSIRIPEDEEGLPATASTLSERDLFVLRQPALNPAYTMILGVVATNPPWQPRQPIKYIYGHRTGQPSGTQPLHWFETSEEQVGAPGGTVVSLADWPALWEHPEQLLKKTLALAKLISRFQKGELANWNALVDAYSFYCTVHKSPSKRFDSLVQEWKRDVSLSSDTNEICTHPAYQQIIGMGVFALPLILAELEREPDHWFWALKSITGEDPVPEEQRGILDQMAATWLDWAEKRKESLASDWLKTFTSELVHE